MGDEIYYDSWKENRDIILEYNQVKLDDVNIVNILGLAIDNVSRDQVYRESHEYDRQSQFSSYHFS